MSNISKDKQKNIIAQIIKDYKRCLYGKKYYMKTSYYDKIVAVAHKEIQNLMDSDANDIVHEKPGHVELDEVSYIYNYRDKIKNIAEQVTKSQLIVKKKGNGNKKLKPVILNIFISKIVRQIWIKEFVFLKQKKNSFLESIQK